MTFVRIGIKNILEMFHEPTWKYLINCMKL